MAKDKWVPGLLYLRTTAGKESHVSWHTCWNTERFLAQRVADAEKANDILIKESEGKRIPDPVSIEVISEEEYWAMKRRGRKAA